MGLRKDCQLCWNWDDCHFDKRDICEHRAEHRQFKRVVKLYRALPWRIVPNVAPLRWMIVPDVVPWCWMIVPDVVPLCWTIFPVSFRGVEWLFQMYVGRSQNWGDRSLCRSSTYQCLTHGKYGVVNQHQWKGLSGYACSCIRNCVEPPVESSQG